MPTSFIHTFRKTEVPNIDFLEPEKTIDVVPPVDLELGIRFDQQLDISKVEPESTSTLDPEEYFYYDCVATDGRWNLWRLIEDDTAIQLTGTNVKLKMSEKIIKTCISVRREKSFWHIDCIGTSGYLYMVTLRNGIKTDEKKIELIGLPRFLIVMKQNTLVVALQDRDLLLVDRSQSKIEVKSFKDPNTENWGFRNFVGSLISGSNNSQKYLNVVSMTSVEKFVLTIDVHGILQVWDTDSLSLVETHQMQKSEGVEDFFIGPDPLQLFCNNNDGYLGTYLPAGNGVFKIWRVNTTGFGGRIVEDLGSDYEIVAETPDDYSTWIVNGFQLLPNENIFKSFQLSITWKSNTSSTMYQVLIPNTKNSEINWYIACDEPFPVISDKVLDAEMSFNEIFGPLGNDFSVIKTAIQIYKEHYHLSIPDSELQSYNSLKSVVRQYIEKSMLPNFTKILKELQRHGSETLAIEFDEVKELFWETQGSRSSVVRPAFPLELALYNRNSSSRKAAPLISAAFKQDGIQIDGKNLLSLLDIAHKFRLSLKHSYLNKISSLLEEDYSFSTNLLDDKVRLTDAYTKIFDKEAIVDLSLYNSLSKIDDINGILTSLYEQVVKAIPTPNIYDDKSLNSWEKSLLVQILFEYSNTIKIVVYDILTLLIATVPESNGIIIKENNSLYTLYLKLLRDNDCLLEFITVDGALFTDQIFENQSIKGSVTKNNMKHTIVNKLWLSCTSLEQKLIFIVEKTINGKTDTAFELTKYLSEKDSISWLARALISAQLKELEQATMYFERFSKLHTFGKPPCQFEALGKITKNYFAEKSFLNTSEFFIASSEYLWKEFDDTVYSLHLVKQITDKSYEAQDHIFRITLAASSYADTFEALKNLDVVAPYAKISLYSKNLARAIIESGNIQLLSDLSKNTKLIGIITDAITRLCEISILDPPEKDPFSFFHALYVWSTAHQDFKTATYSVYLKIKYIEEHMKTKNGFSANILNEFTILLTTLACIPEDDRWVLITDTNSERKVLKELDFYKLRQKYITLQTDILNKNYRV